jgi:hypothetical protein
MNDEERLEIECPECGEKLIVLRIARKPQIQPATVQERDEDRRAFSLREIAEKCGVFILRHLAIRCSW